MKNNKDINILFTEQDIKKRVCELSGQIVKDYKGQDFIAVGLLSGVIPFYVDLVMEMDCMVDFCFLSVKSYGAKTESSGVVRIDGDMNIDVSGKKVLIIDDIIDSGNTLLHVKEYMKQKGAADIKTCCLLDKKIRRTAAIDSDYVGFEIPDEFVVGYGLDFGGKYRNTRYIAALDPEAI